MKRKSKPSAVWGVSLFVSLTVFLSFFFLFIEAIIQDLSCDVIAQGSARLSPSLECEVTQIGKLLETLKKYSGFLVGVSD